MPETVSRGTPGNCLPAATTRRSASFCSAPTAGAGPWPWTAGAGPALPAGGESGFRVSLTAEEPALPAGPSASIGPLSEQLAGHR